MQNLHFHPQLILRTPQAPFSLPIDETRVRELVQKAGPFKEALYLASPTLLSAALTASQLPEKLLLPLTRYVIRSQHRATPFGLFSGVSTLAWGGQTRIALKEEYRSDTRLDMGYLAGLSQQLGADPTLRRHLIYSPNTSHYMLGDQIRFIERTDIPVLTSVKKNSYITAVLEKAVGGADFQTLTGILTRKGVPLQTAEAYVFDLVDSQLLISELEPTVTGDDFFTRIIQVTEKAGHPVAPVLHAVRQRLLDQDSDRYPDVIDLLRKVGEIPSRLFHTIRVNSCTQIPTLSQDYQAEIRRAIQKLSAFAPDQSVMHTFISRFYDRYEDREVPLLSALDTESGIGYPTHTADDYTPLTEGITLPSLRHKSASLKWKTSQQLLFRCLQQAQAESRYEISLPHTDSLPEIPDPPPSLSVMFRLLDQHKLLLEHVGGTSATVLAGRFGCASEEIDRILREIAAEESKKNPEVIFAEIVHFPEGRTGNILTRPAFRAFEIPYLAQSSLPQENQLCLQDLLISVRNNRIILRHSQLNKRVIPRLGCAHNFRQGSLPVYRFLCDLQSQDLQNSFDFSWGDIAREFVFLPRVVEGRVIVSPAMWQMGDKQLDDLREMAFGKWLRQYNLPACFVVAEGDNELFIDTTKKLYRRVFLDTVKGLKRVLLKEYLGSEAVPVKNADGSAMAHQFIAFLTRKDTVYRYKAEKFSPRSVPRTFAPGSEWLYLKYYCGPKSADSVLRQAISPLLREAEIQGWIDQWFFIRYCDTDNHLRVRFHLRDLGFLQQLLCASDRYMQPFIQEGLVWKIQSDTYSRELERYGHEAILPVERLFYIDSRLYIDFLHRTEGDTREEIKWLWGVRNIDRFLETVGLDIPARKRLTLKLRNQFAGEFRMDQNLKTQIDRRYRLCRTPMEDFLTSNRHPIPDFYLLQLRELWMEIRDLTPDDAQLEGILISAIHMSVNRLISSGQRLHELLMYDFLHRHYTSQLAKDQAIRVS